MAKNIENSLCAVLSYQEFFNRKGRKWFTIGMKPSFFSVKKLTEMFLFFSKGTCMHLVPRNHGTVPFWWSSQGSRERIQAVCDKAEESGLCLGQLGLSLQYNLLIQQNFNSLLFLQWIMQLFDFRYSVQIQFLMPFCLSPFSLFTVKNPKCNQCWYSQWCHSHGPAAAGNFCKYLHWS